MGVDIAVDFGSIDGAIKPLHGVNNGPICYGSLVDVSQYYKELGVPWVRIHDPNWPNPREVDYYTIFPDFDKDTNDPASYTFSATDTYIKSIVDTGARIVYRLGVSIEHTQEKYHVHPPSDFHKWAEICIHIIRHYNEGWADGFQYGIKYWEIWNEPEGFPDTPQDKNAMWSGTYEQYFELYNVASTLIKKACPDVFVGGFAYTYVNPEFLHRFLAYAQENRLPLDFFSWHTYACDPCTLADRAREIRETLDRYGFADAKVHCNEYNYAHPMPQEMRLFGPGAQRGTELFFEAAKGEKGAAFNAAVLTLLQDCPVDVLNYYDAAPSSFWSFFNCYGVPQKAYYAFRAFRELYDLGNLAKSTVSQDGLYCLGAVSSDGASGAVLVTGFNVSEKEYHIGLTLPEGRKALAGEVLLTDEENMFVLVESISAPYGMQYVRHLKPYSVLLIRLKFM